MSTINQNTPPQWDVSNVYPSLDSCEFSSDEALLASSLESFEGFLDEHRIGQESGRPFDGTTTELAGFLDALIIRINDLTSLTFTLRSYINSFVSTDSYNAPAKKAFSTWEKHYVRLQQITNRVRAWVGSLGTALPKALEIEGEAREHAFSLLEIAEQSRYMMSQIEEELAAELGLSGAGAWSKLQGTVTSQLGVDFEMDGENKKLCDLGGNEGEVQ